MGSRGSYANFHFNWYNIVLSLHKPDHRNGSSFNAVVDSIIVAVMGTHGDVVIVVCVCTWYYSKVHIFTHTHTHTHTHTRV